MCVILQNIYLAHVRDSFLLSDTSFASYYSDILPFELHRCQCHCHYWIRTTPIDNQKTHPRECYYSRNCPFLPQWICNLIKNSKRRYWWFWWREREKKGRKGSDEQLISYHTECYHVHFANYCIDYIQRYYCSLNNCNVIVHLFIGCSYIY